MTETNCSTLVRSVVNELKSRNHTDGFANTVSSIVRDAIQKEFGSVVADKFWLCECYYSDRVKSLTDLFDGDSDTAELYHEYEEFARRNGFVMPEWGTRGT